MNTNESYGKYFLSLTRATILFGINFILFGILIGVLLSQILSYIEIVFGIYYSLILGLICSFFIILFQVRKSPLYVQLDFSSESLLLRYLDSKEFNIYFTDISFVEYVKWPFGNYLMSITIYLKSDQKVDLYCLYGMERVLLQELLITKIRIVETNGSDYSKVVDNIEHLKTLH